MNRRYYYKENEARKILKLREVIGVNARVGFVVVTNYSVKHTNDFIQQECSHNKKLRLARKFYQRFQQRPTEQEMTLLINKDRRYNWVKKFFGINK